MIWDIKLTLVITVGLHLAEAGKDIIGGGVRLDFRWQKLCSQLLSPLSSSYFFFLQLSISQFVLLTFKSCPLLSNPPT